MGGGLIGRDAELTAAAKFLAGLEDGPAVLVLAGAPGIGKTTVWQEAVARARASSFAVLSARPVEGEAGLAFAGLADLLEPVAGEVLPELPGPQRRALAVALLREDPGGGVVDQRAVCAATNAVLKSLASRGPVVVAVDDLQWLDRPSARVLEFAARRLAGLPVGVVAAERVERGVRLPVALDRVVPEGRFRRVELGPLSLAALYQLLTQRLGRPFTRRMVVRIGQAAGGNPFFALEIARCLPEDAPVSVAALPVPDRLLQLVEARILALPARARQALLAATGLRAPSVETVIAATGQMAARSRRALEVAEARGIIEVAGSRLRFTHPLFAAAVDATAPPAERRRMHRRIAALSEGIEEQARHLALGADGADAGLAAVLDTAAGHAQTRGAPETAAELAEWAAALTPPDRAVEIRRRTVQAAEYHFHAGELRRAREMLEAVLTTVSGGLERAKALRLLGEIHYHEDSVGEAIQVLREALQHAEDDRGLQLAIELSLAFATNCAGDFAGTAEHARRALALAEPGAEPGLVAEALAVAAMAGYLLGGGLDEAKVERALRLEDPCHQVPVEVRPSLIAGFLALYEGQLERCDRLLLALRKRVLEQGEENGLAAVGTHLIWSACWRGDLTAAEAYAVEAIDVAARIGSDAQRCMALADAAVASAYAGEITLTNSRAGEAIALASRTGYDIGMLWASWALGLLALSQGDPQAAEAALAPVAARFEDYVPEPILAFFLPDEIEALIGLSRLQRAGRLLDGFEEAARRLNRPWALMLAARCRALLLAAHGDLDQAARTAQEALAVGQDVELRLELARTFLVAGQIERRRRHKQLARDLLDQALRIFDDAGARLWALRAQLEAGRAAGRPAGRELTASEQAVAQLAASGLTNREVAAQLFMSPKTVEATLARAYRKLGIRSRAQLGTLIGADGRLPKT